MSRLTPYLTARYVDGGRGEVVDGVRQYDCWGIVRAVRAELLGLPPLPSYGAVSPDDRQGITSAADSEKVAMVAGEARPGAIATVWNSRECYHFGVCYEVDGRMGVIEMGRSFGCRWVSLNKFNRKYSRVVYYHD